MEEAVKISLKLSGAGSYFGNYEDDSDDAYDVCRAWQFLSPDARDN